MFVHCLRVQAVFLSMLSRMPDEVPGCLTEGEVDAVFVELWRGLLCQGVSTAALSIAASFRGDWLSCSELYTLE